MNQMQMPLNLEGDEAEGENPEEHSAAIQPDNCCNPFLGPHKIYIKIYSQRGLEK